MTHEEEGLSPELIIGGTIALIITVASVSGYL